MGAVSPVAQCIRHHYLGSQAKGARLGSLLSAQGGSERFRELLYLVSKHTYHALYSTFLSYLLLFSSVEHDVKGY